VDVDADVPLLADDRLTRVEAHANAEHRLVRPCVPGERTLGGDGRRHGVPGALEAEEERVALRVDLLAAPRGERVADHPPVLGEGVRVAVAERLEELGRALDVGEDEGDGAAVQRRHALSLSSSSSSTCARRRRSLGFASLTISSR
jgi:hypothetical protein